MKHASIRELFDYWNAQRGSRAMPDRADIEPGSIRRVLADTFILTVDPSAGHPFRIAGTRVCAAFGRELKDTAFADLWSADGEARIRDLIHVLTTESIGFVAGASGCRDDGATLDLELLALPLAHRERGDARLLGALVPRQVPYWLGVNALGRLTLGTVRYLGRQTAIAPAPRPMLDILPAGRPLRGLVVYDGGRPDHQ